MRLKNANFMLFMLLVILFIGVGDRISPEPLSSYSRNTRENINSYLVALFPQREFENTNQLNQEKLQKIEQKMDEIEQELIEGN